MRYLLLILTLIGCASVASYTMRDPLHVRVESINSDANVVRLFCHPSGGMVGFPIRDMTIVSVVKKTVALNGCRLVKVVLEEPGGYYLIPDPVMVRPGDTLRVTARRPLRMSFYYLRAGSR